MARQLLGLKKGDVYSGDRLWRGVAQLGDLGVSLESHEFKPAEGNLLDITLELKEHTPGALNAGPCYAWRHGPDWKLKAGLAQNRLAQGRGMFEAKGKWGPRGWDLAGDWQRRWPRDLPLVLGLRFDQGADKRPYLMLTKGFEERRIGGGAYAWHFSEHPWTPRFSYEFSHVEYRPLGSVPDAVLGRRHGDRSMLAARFSSDHSRGQEIAAPELFSTLPPMRPLGVSYAGRLDLAGGPLGGDYRYVKADASVDARMAAPRLREVPAVLAFLLGVTGTLPEDGSVNVPVGERVFRGGPRDGYDYRGQIGPAEGGSHGVEGTAGYMVPVWTAKGLPMLSCSGLYRFTAAWRTFGEATSRFGAGPADLRQSVGAGLRIATPRFETQGPGPWEGLLSSIVELSWAHGLNHGPGENRDYFHIMAIFGF